MMDTNNLGYRFGTYLKKLKLEKKASQPVLYYAQLAIIIATLFSIIAFGMIFAVLLFALYAVLSLLKKGNSNINSSSDDEEEGYMYGHSGPGYYIDGWKVSGHDDE